MNRGHDGDAKIDQAAAITHAESAILRNPAFGDIQFRHHFDASNKILDWNSRARGAIACLEHTVNAVLHHHGIVAAFNVDVRLALRSSPAKMIESTSRIMGLTSLSSTR